MSNPNQFAFSTQVSGFNSQVSPTSSLLPLLLTEIEQAGGMIPFRRFMEHSLYHPDHGYYASGRARIGKEGDFFTSVSVGRIYGRLLASICREVWERLGSPEIFTIVEQGANDGMLAADILAACAADDFAKALRYHIFEPFSVNRQRQQERLAEFAGVSWFASLEELPNFTGIHLSNELLDAFPVDSLRWNGAVWEEECVCRNGEELLWKTRQITDPELVAAAERLPKDLAVGFRFEVNLGIAPWLKSIREKMDRGILLTIDYGQAGDDRYAPHRADGTLLAYAKHQRFDDPLPEPGERDITAQVDFTMLAEQAKTQGFELLGYSDQHHFLMGAAEPWLRSLRDSAPEHKRDLRALQTLLHPGTMGRQFKAIAFAKNGKELSALTELSCFKYQRPGTDAL